MLTARFETCQAQRGSMPAETHDSNAAYFLGLDGGGTKTDCVLVDADGNMLARSTAGPSNPIRAGYAKAWFTLSDAADVVLEHHHIKAGDIRGIYAGIGGAGREAVARRIATFLENGFPQAAVTVTTDLAITLQAARWRRRGNHSRDRSPALRRTAGMRAVKRLAPAAAARGSAMRAAHSTLGVVLFPPWCAPKKTAVRRRPSPSVC